MTKATATVAAVVVMVAAGPGQGAEAAPRAERTVVVHVTDHARISPADLLAAEQLATRVYDSAGVHVIWTDRKVDTVQSDDAFHVNVIVLSREMAEDYCRTGSIAEGTFGTAAQVARRAHIFYSRIADYAASPRIAVSRPLGIVLAHEIGHLLLPGHAHSPSGIMRAEWNRPLVQVPDFTGDQGATIRARLAHASLN
jgi:hypothetical protein